MLDPEVKKKISAMPEAFKRAWEIVSPYTMTSPERGFALWQAVEHIIVARVPGCLIECGVWKGGSTMLMALALEHFGEPQRQIFMFDTFAGMTSPSQEDKDLYGRSASDMISGRYGAATTEAVKANSNLDEVLKNLEIISANRKYTIKIVPGDVKETLPRTQTLNIALLRLDTDFYDSTQAELRILYPKVSKGGVVIIDDYGHWQGAKQAVDEYFDVNGPGKRKQMLWPLDYTGRGFVKSDDATAIDIERYDRVPKGYGDPKLLALFPDASVIDPRRMSWKYMRPEVPHIFRVDRRGSPGIGNASYEEACCLYTLASQFRGKRGLEVGTHLGWTGAHLLAAGLRMDFVDPAIANAERAKMLVTSFDAVPNRVSYKMYAQPSPQSIEPIFREGNSELWSFAFIDGNHDGDAPMFDAKAVLPFMADDSCVMFHDLTSPHVAAGLQVFQEAGWNIEVFQTMQILGVASRGQVVIPPFQKDNNVPKVLPSHLKRFL